MQEPEYIKSRIKDTGFHCLYCGACCSGRDNEVMVSPPEIHRLTEATGLTQGDIAEPYPEWIEESGAAITFGWVLRRGADGNCMFLRDKRCTVYFHRPHICRTYPFMLNDQELIISECPGRRTCSETKDAEEIAKHLLCRRAAEDEEFFLTRQQYQKHSITSGSTIVFDSSGAHIYTIPPKKS